MATITVMVQNIAGNILKKGKVGGKLCPLKINVHKLKPAFLALVETRQLREFNGAGLFRGYELIQAASSGDRSGGVMLFKNKSIDLIEGSASECINGRFTIGCYRFFGTKIVVGAVYGYADANDTQSLNMYKEIAEKIETLTQVNNTRNVILCGDFNLHLDQGNPKPLTYRYINELIREYDLIDSGKNKKAPTWRRPNRPGTKSRIDYIMYSQNMQGSEVEVSWSQLDHSQMTCRIEVGQQTQSRKTSKDWVLAQPEYIKQAQQIIKQTLIDHSQHHSMSNQEREEYTQDEKNQGI